MAAILVCVTAMAFRNQNLRQIKLLPLSQAASMAKNTVQQSFKAWLGMDTKTAPSLF